MTYQFIEQQKQEFPVVVMCRVLEVSESGLYAWRKRPTCQHKREDARLTEEIRQVFSSHREKYGSPRIHAEAIRSRDEVLPQTGSSTDARGATSRQTKTAVGGDHEERRIPSCGSQSLTARFYGQRTKHQMGRRRYLCAYHTRMALPGGDPGLVFTGRGGMVHVSLL
jgi:hypothetical protein